MCVVLASYYLACSTVCAEAVQHNAAKHVACACLSCTLTDDSSALDRHKVSFAIQGSIVPHCFWSQVQRVVAVHYAIQCFVTLQGMALHARHVRLCCASTSCYHTLPWRMVSEDIAVLLIITLLQHRASKSIAYHVLDRDQTQTVSCLRRLCYLV